MDRLFPDRPLFLNRRQLSAERITDCFLLGFCHVPLP
jgi:hypothetical protein